MIRNRTIAAAIVLIPLAVICCRMLMPTSLDFSEDEAPFRDIRMPPKLVRGDRIIMHVSCAVVEIVDQNDHHHFISFPSDFTGIRHSFPKAYNGQFNDPAKRLLKNPDRARDICIQLLKDYASPNHQDPSYDLDKITLRVLSNPPQVVASRVFSKIQYYLFH